MHLLTQSNHIVWSMSIKMSSISSVSLSGPLGFCASCAGAHADMRICCTHMPWNTICTPQFVNKSLFLFSALLLWLLHLSRIFENIPLGYMWTAIIGNKKCAQWRLSSDYANAQAGLNLRWAHMSAGTFSEFATHLSYTKWKKAQTDHAVCCSHIPKDVQLESMGEVIFVVGSKCFINQ